MAKNILDYVSLAEDYTASLIIILDAAMVR